MAQASLCGKLIAGFDAACSVAVRKYFQEACIINKADIDTQTVTLPDYAAGSCSYNVAFSLVQQPQGGSDTQGLKFRAPDGGQSIFGFYEKTVNDYGKPQYRHVVQILLEGVTENVKCILDGLDKGSFVVALQIGDVVEIFGLYNGLSSTDYTYSVQENGGGALLQLASTEAAPEPTLPLVYVSGTPGNEIADFDGCFLQPAAP